MHTLNDFALKQRKYMPTFPKAIGKPTVYIEGYPCEDDEPMGATAFHSEQITTLSEQLSRYFAIDAHIYIGVDNFIYYREDDMKKFVSPDVYVVLGADKHPLRRSFYTWAEGAIPTTVFEFLSDATANRDRHEKVRLYLLEMGVQEYFIHQPEMEKPAEFRGWRGDASGGITEILPEAQGGLFSEALNLYFRWEDQLDTHVRLLRPYLPDGTPITTSREEAQLRIEERQLRREEQQLRIEERQLRREEQQRRREEQQLRIEEQQRRREEHNLRVQAEAVAEAAAALAAAETQRRREVEAELERLRSQLALVSDK